MKAKPNLLFQGMVLLALAGTAIVTSCNMGRGSQNNMHNEKTTSEITVTGTALHTKAGAIVQTDAGEIYYISNQHDWNELYKKKIRVTGTLKTEVHESEDLKDENGHYKQGMTGEVKWIENARVEKLN